MPLKNRGKTNEQKIGGAMDAWEGCPRNQLKEKEVPVKREVNSRPRRKSARKNSQSSRCKERRKKDESPKRNSRRRGDVCIKSQLKTRTRGIKSKREREIQRSLVENTSLDIDKRQRSGRREKQVHGVEGKLKNPSNKRLHRLKKGSQFPKPGTKRGSVATEL